MKPLELAQAEVLGSMRHSGAETIELVDALGRVLAADVEAREAVPHFPNSAMDGYAVQSGDVAREGAMLRVVGEIAAGSPSDATLQPGCAMKIMTGAPMPDGADTVVRVEDTERLDDVVKIQVEVPAGTSVRPAGDDIPEGTTVFERGVRLQSTHLGVLATVGISRPSVARRPRVALFSTGDELASPSAATLVPGQIRDSNRVMLRSLLSDVATVMDDGIIRDDPVALRAGFGRAAAGADAIVASGGVSMGDHDHVRYILGDMGSVDFWRVAIKPAKPFAFGQIGGVPFFGLPGNPVSAFIAFEQLVRPALLEMQGALVHFRPLIRATAGAKIDSDPGRLEFVRVTLQIDGRGRLVASPSGGQGSHMLAALAAADGLARIPVGESGVKAGQSLDVEMFRNPETRRWER